MNAITVRNLPRAVAKAVRAKAMREKLRLNQAIVKLLEEATGTTPRRRVVHHDLDGFFGTWTQEQADAFDEALREQRQVDLGIWR